MRPTSAGISLRSNPSRSLARPCFLGCTKDIRPALPVAAGPPERELFGRTYELDRLDSLFNKSPTAIQIVLGPRNCGKSALLVHYLTGKEHAVYTDLRTIDTSNPAVLVKTLLKQLLPKIPTDTIGQVLKNLGGWPDLVLALVTGIEVTGKWGKDVQGAEGSIKTAGLASWLADIRDRAPNAESRDINDVYQALRMTLDAWEKSKAKDPASEGKNYQWPILVIDEANRIMPWSTKHPEQLVNLLDFIVNITKQTNRCHVVLATSESGFQSWLGAAVGLGFWKSIVIGDFTKDDARAFLDWNLHKIGSKITVDDSSWEEVYKVCGGNAGALQQLAAGIDEKFHRGNWTEALRSLWSPMLLQVELLASGKAGYSSAQYADAALMLLEPGTHVVGLRRMAVKLGRHLLGDAASENEAAEAGQPVLQRMVEHNALSLRPFSAWAQDIPLEVFKEDESVVTAPSAMHLFCMGRLKSKLESTLSQWEEEQKRKQQGALGWLQCAAEDVVRAVRRS